MSGREQLLMRQLDPVVLWLSLVMVVHALIVGACIICGAAIVRGRKGP